MAPRSPPYHHSPPGAAVFGHQPTTQTCIVHVRPPALLWSCVVVCRLCCCSQRELELAGSRLGFPFRTPEALHAAFVKMDKDGNGRISQQEFAEWWNSSKDPVSRELHARITRSGKSRYT